MKKIIFILPAFLLLFILPACNNYGDEKDYNGVQLYHTKSVTGAEADRLGNFLLTEKFADGRAKTVQFTKAGDVYQFRFVVKSELIGDSGLFHTLKLFSSILSSQVFNNAPVEVHMCDDYLRTVKVFASKDNSKMKLINGADVFYANDINDAIIDTLGTYLVGSKFANGKEKTIQIAKRGNFYQFKFVIKKGYDKDRAYLQTVGVFANELSTHVFHSPVEVDLCDDNLHTLAAVPMSAAR